MKRAPKPNTDEKVACGAKLAAALDRHTAWPIAFTALLGAGIVGSLVWGYVACCGPNSGGICALARKNPPWLLLTTLLAAPSALLTWYWRTKHKKADLANARSAELNTRFASGVELLSKGDAATLGAIYALEQLARDSEVHHWPVVETLAAFLRQHRTDTQHEREAPQIQAAITVLGRRDVAQDPPKRRIDLSRANLRRVDFSGGKFSRARFARADASEARFFRCDLTRADFTSTCVDDAELDGADLTGACFGVVSPIRDGTDRRFKYDDKTKAPPNEKFTTYGIHRTEWREMGEMAAEAQEEAARAIERARAEERERQRAERAAAEAAANAAPERTAAAEANPASDEDAEP